MSSVNSSLSPIQLEIESVIAKIEQKDQSVVHLKNIGDGYLRLDTDRFNGIKRKLATDTTLSDNKETRPIFEHEIVIVNEWNKNAVYYNLDEWRFPNVKNIVMMSHPCEYSVIFRFPKANWILPYNVHRFFKDQPRAYLVEDKYERIDKAVNEMPYYTTDCQIGSVLEYVEK